MTDSEILQAAANRVRQGWCQNALFDLEDGACAIGAIGHVLTGMTDSWTWVFSKAEHWGPIYKGDLFVWIGRALGLPPDLTKAQLHYRIVDWNNAEGQTAENVALTLELAAILADQQPAVIRLDPEVTEA